MKSCYLATIWQQGVIDASKNWVSLWADTGVQTYCTDSVRSVVPLCTEYPGTAWQRASVGKPAFIATSHKHCIVFHTLLAVTCLLGPSVESVIIGGQV